MKSGLVPLFLCFFVAMRKILFLLFTVTHFSLLASPADTVRVRKGELLILKDTIFAPSADTQIVVRNLDYQLKGNPYQNSQKFYDRMREISGKNKITARLFDLLYVEESAQSEFGKNPESRNSIEPFLPYEDLRVGKITIRHVDILQGDVNDTLRRATAYYAKAANRIHMKTWNSIIRNTITINSGEQLNPYTVADSERLLRRLQFIQDARIYVEQSADNQEADITVVVQDRFSYGLRFDVDAINSIESRLINRNIAGIGKYASASYIYDGKSEDKHGYSFQAGGQQIGKLIANIRLNHTNINTRKEWGAELDKPFVSPETKYGGGVDIRNVADSVLQFDGLREHVGYYRLNYQDLWIGRSIALPTKYQRQNITWTARWLRSNFRDRPFVSADSNNSYYSRNLLLSELSISSQKFMKTNYISSFGISEDIPMGYRLSIVGGKDFNEFYTQDYIGFQIFFSTYFVNWGYILLNQEVGTCQNGPANRGVFKTNINYFSPLFDVGNYYLRNFFKFSFVKGIDQPVSSNISLEDRIRDLQNSNFPGNSAISFTVEQVTFTPWYFYGFRFAPFVYYNVGEIWDYREDRSFSHGYQGMGGGLRIRNESLAFSTLELRVTHFITGQNLEKSTVFSLSSTMPINFNNIFRFKPTIAAFR